MVELSLKYMLHSMSVSMLKVKLIFCRYPLDMGRKKTTSQAVVPLQLDNTGKLQYEAVLGTNKIAASKYTDLVEKQVTEEEMQRPDEETLAATTEKTRLALEKLVQGTNCITYAPY